MAYQSMLVYDSAFLLSRTIVLCLLMYYAFRSAPKWARPGVWIPVATTIFDLFENFLIYGLIVLYPRRIDAMAQLTAYAIMWKWVWLWATVASLCVGLLAGIYYGFHGLLAESVLMERDKEKRDMAKRHLSAAMQRAKDTQARVKRENADKTKKDR
ncbi:hypothetical protein CLU79DRAFT_731210 [Phycomyces nitens]|nr:hypothetical protein CLU79DRAFT_731210 [Phycomyces nitens]